MFRLLDDKISLVCCHFSNHRHSEAPQFGTRNLLFRCNGEEAYPSLPFGMTVFCGGGRLYSPAASNPALRKMRRTFLGDTDNLCATRETLRPSRIQTLGITISANSSVTC